MKIKDYKCKCGHDDFFFADKGSQKGIYCSYCGKWFKWADKDEQNLPMKQVPVLDKLKAEIIENSIEDYKYHGCGSDELIIETSEVLQIIDKYEEGSEEQ